MPIRPKEKLKKKKLVEAKSRLGLRLLWLDVKHVEGRKEGNEGGATLWPAYLSHKVLNSKASGS